MASGQEVNEVVQLNKPKKVTPRWESNEPLEIEPVTIPPGPKKSANSDDEAQAHETTKDAGFSLYLFNDFWADPDPSTYKPATTRGALKSAWRVGSRPVAAPKRRATNHSRSIMKSSQ